MALPLIPIFGGVALAKWGPALWGRVKGLFHHEPALDLDANITDTHRADVMNLLTEVHNPVTIKAAAAWYQSQGFPVAAETLKLKLNSLVRGGG